jgi:hypothetical protein
MNACTAIIGLSALGTAASFLWILGVAFMRSQAESRVREFLGKRAELADRLLEVRRRRRERAQELRRRLPGAGEEGPDGGPATQGELGQLSRRMKADPELAAAVVRKLLKSPR